MGSWVRPRNVFCLKFLCTVDCRRWFLHGLVISIGRQSKMFGLQVLEATEPMEKLRRLVSFSLS